MIILSSNHALRADRMRIVPISRLLNLMGRWRNTISVKLPRSPYSALRLRLCREKLIKMASLKLKVSEETSRELWRRLNSSRDIFAQRRIDEALA